MDVESEPRSTVFDLSVEPSAYGAEIDLLGKLADTLAHKINNILAAIMGLSSVLEGDIDPASPSASDVHEILAACRRGVDLTRGLSRFSRNVQLQQRPVSADALMTTVAKSLEASLPPGIIVQTKLQSNGADIFGDAGLLQQAILGVTTNAVEAMGGRGALTLVTKVVPADATGRLIEGLTVSEVHVQVSDTGSGMSAAVMERALQPFFTTKTRDTAAGLGLSLTYAIARRHGGGVRLYSKEGLGTTVTIALPLLDGSEEPLRSPPPPRAARTGAGLVLVVDDEPALSGALERLLGKLGFRVVVASSGEAALKILSARAGTVSLVVLDLIMPGMDGFDVLRKIRQIQPEPRVLLMSGSAEDAVSTRRGGAAGFIQKPFTLEQLAVAIEAALA